jgi:hypothetical protein
VAYIKLQVITTVKYIHANISKKARARKRDMIVNYLEYTAAELYVLYVQYVRTCNVHVGNGANSGPTVARQMAGGQRLYVHVSPSMYDQAKCQVIQIYTMLL